MRKDRPNKYVKVEERRISQQWEFPYRLWSSWRQWSSMGLKRPASESLASAAISEDSCWLCTPSRPLSAMTWSEQKKELRSITVIVIIIVLFSIRLLMKSNQQTHKLIVGVKDWLGRMTVCLGPIGLLNIEKGSGSSLIHLKRINEEPCLEFLPSWAVCNYGKCISWMSLSFNWNKWQIPI